MTGDARQDNGFGPDGYFCEDMGALSVEKGRRQAKGHELPCSAAADGKRWVVQVAAIFEPKGEWQWQTVQTP